MRSQYTLSISALCLATLAGISIAIGLERAGRAKVGPDTAPPPLVLCSACYYGELPREPHLILLDTQSSEVWAYSDKAMSGKVKPTSMGKLRLGEPLQRRSP